MTEGDHPTKMPPRKKKKVVLGHKVTKVVEQVVKASMHHATSSSNGVTRSTSTPSEPVAQSGAFVMIPTPLGINSTRMESQGQPPHHYDDVPHDIDHENDLDDDDDDVENEEAQLPHALIDLDLVCLETHIRKKDNTWVDKRLEQTYGDFQKKLQEDSSDGTKAINATSRVKLRADIARDKSQGCLYGAGDMFSHYCPSVESLT
ncbi:hypothetical protein HKD37_09G025415 [Glycine soja]